MSSLFNKQVME